ncbi:MAG: hypothetical protein JWP63_6683 [Candidatus Solibacter sp.]|jgi:hypothetical protein|nr:hypothetical protein [Candidatus Solibacter sp.]
MNSQTNCRRIIRRKFSLLLLAVVVSATTLLAANTNPGIAPPNSNPLGASYARWGAAWWQWVFSLHANVPLNPLRATGAVDCSYGQVGQVWFLTGSFIPGTTERSCKVPTGTRLFLPVLNAWADNTGPASGPTKLTPEELKALAAFYTEAQDLHASIDGVQVQNLFAYRAAYAPFSYTVPATDNMIQFFGGDVPGKGWLPEGSTFVTGAASDGYWLMLEPLPPGSHTIEFGATAKNGGFQIDIIYRITVVPKGQF